LSDKEKRSSLFCPPLVTTMVTRRMGKKVAQILEKVAQTVAKAKK
jgi:hypothetical protein